MLNKITRIENKRNLRRLALSFLYNPYMYLQSSFQDKDYKPVFILATPRSGSNLMSTLLNSYDNVLIYDELLNAYNRPIYGKKKEYYLNHISRTLRSRCTCFYTPPMIQKKYQNFSFLGTKIFPGHLRETNLKSTDLVDRFPHCRLILLYRNDLILQYVSMRLSQETQQFFTEHDLNPTTSITIDISDLKHYCQKRTSKYSSFVQELSGHHSLLLISYEELAANMADTFKSKICPFLELDYKQQEPIIKKQNPGGLSCCSNRAEIESLYQNSLFTLNINDLIKSSSHKSR